MKTAIAHAPRAAALPGSREEPSDGKAAFTLLELLVVVAIIALLAGLLLPALSGAAAKGRAIACLNHHRQLALTLEMYAGDYQGRLPPNMGEAGTRRTVERGEYANWVNNVMNWELDAENTNTALLARGGLGAYLPGSPEIFHCPADRAASQVQQARGWSHRVRSVSLNAMVGYAGEFLNDGVNTNNPSYRQFFRSSDIPQPSQIFTFLEEHPDSINDGYFLNRIYGYQWIDLPASYHSGAANLAFADGHVERRKWLDQSTRPAPAPGAAGLPFRISPTGVKDFQWLARRMSVEKVEHEHAY